MNALTVAHSAAIAKLCKLTPPVLSPYATPEEIMALHDYLTGLIEIVDPLVFVAGQEFCATSGNVHKIASVLALFKDQLRAALDGNALYELTAAAEAAEQEYQDAAE